MNNKTKKTFPALGRVTAIAAAAGLALTACGDGEAADTGGNGGDTIEMGIFQGWEEGIAVSELWANILEDEGYTVNKTYVDLAPGYSGIASGDIDFVMDVWQPVTHADYIEEYGDDIEKVGEWNSDARQVIAVNEDAPVDSLDELADHADDFDNTLVGIEPGAGLTERTESYVIPDYGLDDWDFTTSSTPAMLQELDTTLSAGDNIAVTLWMPHWAFNAYDIKPLDDPQEALGQEEHMTTYAHNEFSDNQPEVFDWLADFKIDTDTLQDLEEDLFVEDVDQSDYPDVVRDWMDENQDYVDSLTS